MPDNFLPGIYNYIICRDSMKSNLLSKKILLLITVFTGLILSIPFVVFSNQEKCQRRVLKYWNGEATVTVRDYVSAIKNIKSRIFFNN